MPQLRPLSISLDINLDQQGKGATKRRAPATMPFPDGFNEIKARLKKRGEGDTYAQEHAARIWNDSHPEEPVETSFDGENGGFIPGNSNLEKDTEKAAPKKDVKLKDKKKKKKHDRDDEEDGGDE